MDSTDSRSYLIVAIAAGVACLLQIFGLIRYVERMPKDGIGIGLYAATILAFALASFGFFRQARKK